MFKYNLTSMKTLKAVAEKPLDEKSVDKNKIKELCKYPDLLKKLDSWILSPDRKLLPYIVKLGKIIDNMYNLKDIIIFRGMSVGFISFGQQYMGLVDKTLFGGTKLKKGVVPGYKFDYTPADPISFSWDQEIAMAFGNLVVSCISKKSSPRLVITDELNLIISKMRNIVPVTQREVICFPQAKLSCKVVSIS